MIFVPLKLVFYCYSSVFPSERPVMASVVHTVYVKKAKEKCCFKGREQWEWIGLWKVAINRHLVRNVVIDVHFFFFFGRHFGIILFPFPLTTADWIGIVWTIRRGAANFCGTSLFKIFFYLQHHSCYPSLAWSIAGRAYWRGRGWEWSQIPTYI